MKVTVNAGTTVTTVTAQAGALTVHNATDRHTIATSGGSVIGMTQADRDAIVVAQAAAVGALGYETRAEAEAANVPAAVKTLRVGGLAYRRDAAGTALTTADGQNWSPADPVPTVKHYAQALNLNNDDAPAVNALIAEAAARGDREVHINSPVRAMTPINLYGGIVHRFGGPITWAGGAGHVVGIVERAGYEERGAVHNLEIVGSPAADYGLRLDHCRYWDLYGTRIRGFTKPGAWAMVTTTTDDNRQASHNNFKATFLHDSDNLLLIDSGIGQLANSGSSFNTFDGGRGDGFGSNLKTVNCGVQNKVGEGNKFINFRVAAKYEWSRCWDLNDAACSLIGCAGDGGVGSPFVYFLAGTTGTINSITVAGTAMLQTPVAWQGTADATATAVVAQIVADGRQYPATSIRAVAYGPQVIFYNVDGADNEVFITQSSALSAPKTGDITFGTSLTNGGLLQGAVFASYQAVNRNKWGYETGRGGNREVYGVYLNPGSAGTIQEQEGNGPQHLVWFSDTNTQRSWNIIRKGHTIFADGAIATDVVTANLSGYIAAHIEADPGVASVTHQTQSLWIVNDGAFITALFDLRFTPTIVSGIHNFWIDLPQKPGVYNTTTPLDVGGLPYRQAIEARGLNATGTGKTIFAFPQGNVLSPLGNPCWRIYRTDGSAGAIMNTSYFTSGQQVVLSGQVRYPVDRFR